MNEVILYAAIATIVCVMLYSVLGKSVGQGPESAFDPKDLMNDAAPDMGFAEIVESDQGIPGLKDIIAADASFSASGFLDGAKGAYGMILEAFAEGNREQLEELLTPDVYAVYAAAITDREEKNLTQVTDLARLKTAQILRGEKAGNVARIFVEYDAELSSALVDADGHTVEGDPDVLSSVTEVWTFERAFKSKDLNWLLCDVAPSEGDELAADPTPDTKTSEKKA